VNAAAARRVHVKGVVQGVGFRPFVYQIAHAHELRGWVKNTSGDVTIVVEGPDDKIEKFLHALKTQPPPQSHIESIAVDSEPPANYSDFRILESQAQEDEYQLISPDLATCPACRKEIFDPANRRYHYPFTNCTNCGPRFTIIEDIPYDRPRTTMRKFKMCPDCRREYDDPADRRFHAQPNACPVCGPRLWIVGPQTDDNGRGQASPLRTTDVIAEAARLIKDGQIVAIKGLGGFLLACDATSDAAVQRLRARKQRPAKPFAIMLSSLDEVKAYCEVNAQEEEALMSAAAPIVVLKIKGKIPLYPPFAKGEAAQPISTLVAPGLKHLGVMVPYTPVHHLLMQAAGRPLVMTSGNLAEEPIAADNDEALRRLSGIADYFVLHDREIYSRYDDSVVTFELGAIRTIRRARGYAPFPVRLPFPLKPVLACGPELKNTFCLTSDDYAFVSQHIGDLENEETLAHFENTINLYEKLFRVCPEAIACDLHPDYLATKWAEAEAKKRSLPLVPVQHHYAHIVSCLAENGAAGPAVGIALDGTGYGTDGRIWGGELMTADYQGFQRRAHFEYLPLPGGAAAIQRPYRIAAGYLYALLGAEALRPDLPGFKGMDEYEIDVIKKQVESGLNTPLTSSCGRLFDAVSALLGIRRQVEYEGQAAIELEAAADEGILTAEYPYRIETVDGMRIIRLRELLAAIVADIQRQVPVSIIAAQFHNTLARIMIKSGAELAEESGLRQVALSGGVFQNRRLLNQVVTGLKQAGLAPLVHRQLPTNDGCISLGQAVAAGVRER
jgi:hydrogenase maturation protein HypF